MKDAEDEAFEQLSLKQGSWEYTSGWRKKQIMDTQAFPNPHRTDMTGMTLRDYFAARAMQAFANEYFYDNSDVIADKAYTLADAMLKARETRLAQPEQERNFCSRCGKRTPDLTHIHTCTPPRGDKHETNSMVRPI